MLFSTGYRFADAGHLVKNSDVNEPDVITCFRVLKEKLMFRSASCLSLDLLGVCIWTLHGLSWEEFELRFLDMFWKKQFNLLLENSAQISRMFDVFSWVSWVNVHAWHLIGKTVSPLGCCDFLLLLQNLSLVERGCLSNLRKQIQIAHLFGVPVVVALNVFKWDAILEPFFFLKKTKTNVDKLNLAFHAALIYVYVFEVPCHIFFSSPPGDPSGLTLRLRLTLCACSPKRAGPRTLCRATTGPREAEAR